jgi:predicted dehydrogenase
MNLRVGIIGAGFIATRGHVPAYRAVPGVEVVALCDINEKRARAVSEELGIPQAYTDYHAMLEHENLDVVSVCSPNAFHAQMTIDALNAGAHVLCEKPMALNYADAQAMFAASQRAGRSLTIGFHMRYQPEFQTVKQILSDGKLGEVYYIKSSMLRRNGIPGYGSWFTNKDLAGGGAMMDIGCHMLDLSLWMLGHPKPLTVTANLYAKFGPRAKGLGTWGIDHFPAGARFDVDDLATAFIRFEGGITLLLEVSWAGHSTPGHRLQIMGTEGGIEVDPRTFGRERPVHVFIEQDGELAEEELAIDPAVGSSYQREIAAWLQAIEAGSSPLVAPEQAALAVQITEAIYQSAATGKEVAINS